MGGPWQIVRASKAGRRLCASVLSGARHRRRLTLPLLLIAGCGPAMVTEYVRPVERDAWAVRCDSLYPAAGFRRCVAGWPVEACPRGYEVVAYQDDVWCRRQREAIP